MAQGITIKGKTLQGQNVEVQVDSAGVIQVAVVSGGGSGGTDPTLGYGLNDKDLADATYLYYGYENSAGLWFIRRVNKSSGQVRYAIGTGSYDFSTRAGLTYLTFGGAF